MTANDMSYDAWLTLTKRIRELEAVIAAGTEYTGQILARAEKAEARAQDAEETCILFAEEESKLRARVAELETGERFTEKQFRALEKAGWHLLEAREREAD